MHMFIRRLEVGKLIQWDLDLMLQYNLIVKVQKVFLCHIYLYTVYTCGTY